MTEYAGRLRRGAIDRVIYLGMGLTIIVFVFIGFGPSYYFRDFSSAPPLPPLLHVHGLLFSLWLAAFMTQTVLISARQVAIHQRLGVFGVGLAVLMILVGATTLVQRAPLHPDPPLLYAVALGDLAMFAAFVALAGHFRKESEAHKRLMVLATIAIIDAAVGRWPFVASLFISRRTQYLALEYLITDSSVPRTSHPPQRAIRCVPRQDR